MNRIEGYLLTVRTDVTAYDFPQSGNGADASALTAKTLKAVVSAAKY